MKYKRILSMILAIMMLITFLPTDLIGHATKKEKKEDGGLSGDNGGGGDSSSTGGLSSSTWNKNQQGYRFTIIDRNGTPVSKSVDVLKSSNRITDALKGDYYTNPRTAGVSKDTGKYVVYNGEKLTYDGSPIFPPNLEIWPIMSQGNKLSGRGKEFQAWFITGSTDGKLDDSSIFEEENKPPLGRPSTPNRSPKNPVKGTEGMKETTVKSKNGNYTMKIKEETQAQKDEKKVKSFTMPSSGAYGNATKRKYYIYAADKIMKENTHTDAVKKDQANWTSNYAKVLNAGQKSKEYAEQRALSKQSPPVKPIRPDLLINVYTATLNSVIAAAQKLNMSNAAKVQITCEIIDKVLGTGWSMPTLKNPPKKKSGGPKPGGIGGPLDSMSKAIPELPQTNKLNQYASNTIIIDSLDGIFDLDTAYGDKSKGEPPYKQLLSAEGGKLFAITASTMNYPDNWLKVKDDIIRRAIAEHEGTEPEDIIPDASGNWPRASISKLPTKLRREVKKKINDTFNGMAKTSVPIVTKRGEEQMDIGTIISENDLALLVEPVFWFKPAGWSNGKLGSAWGKFVYGTEANLAHAHTHTGARSHVGGYTSVLNKLGWSSLTTEEFWGGKIKPAHKKTGSMSPSETDTAVKGGSGVAMHLYTGDDFDTPDSSTRTYDNPNKTEHPAPDPTKIKPPGDREPLEKPKFSITIVKYYELHHAGEQEGEVTRSNHMRIENPNIISIDDEKKTTGYELYDWYTDSKKVTKESDYKEVYDENKTEADIIRQGTGETTITMDYVPKKDEGKEEITLYVKLVKKEDPDEDPNYESQEIVIEESEINKAFSQKTINEQRGYTVIYEESAYPEGHTVYCKDPLCAGHQCNTSTTDPESRYTYDFMNYEPINTLLQGDNVNNFHAVYTRNNYDNYSGISNLNGGTNRVSDDNFNLQFTLHRGYDEVTLAEYTQTDKAGTVKPLLEGRQGNVPKGARLDEWYDSILDLDLQISESTEYSSHGDVRLETQVRHSSEHCSMYEYGETQVHEPNETPKILDYVTVKVYSGKIRDIANEFTEGVQQIAIANMTKSAGKMAQNPKGIAFHPYIRMTYQKTEEYSSKNEVNILGIHARNMLPVDYAEFGWKSNKDDAINLSSQQWSVHAKATQGNDGWQGRNQVLPGGAILSMNIKEEERPLITVNTWQTLLLGKSRQVAEEHDTLGDEYTVSKAEKEHTEYLDDVIATLESLGVSQWVNPNNNAINAWSDGGILVESGKDIGPLDGKTASTEDKYYFRQDPDGYDGSANGADLDVVKESNSRKYYRVYSDYKGNIYFASADSESAIQTATGSILFDKKVTWQEAAPKLQAMGGIAYELDLRTKLITNYMKAIERNTGNDATADWAPDSKWYNEAFEGVYILYQSDKLRVGFMKPPLRTSVLDPKLTPQNVGQSSQFTKAYLSQYRLNDTSSREGVADYGPHYVGHFKGYPIYGNSLDEMLKSRKFYIPNVNVQDLR